jgi:hypothetical protein
MESGLPLAIAAAIASLPFVTTGTLLTHWPQWSPLMRTTRVGQLEQPRQKASRLPQKPSRLTQMDDAEPHGRG